MYSTPKESDPLLPSYEPAPEISQHHHSSHSQEINYGTYIDPTSSATPPAQDLWNRKDELAASRRRWEDSELEAGEDDEEPSRTIEDTMSRFVRGVFTLIFFGLFFAFVVSMLNSTNSDGEPSPPPRTSPRPHPGPGRTTEERAKAILASTPLIDGHDDLAIFIRGEYKNNVTSDRFKRQFEDGGMPLNLDLPRLRSGQNGGAFWSAFVACPANASYDMTDSNYATAVSHTIEQIDVLNRLQEQYPSDFTSATKKTSRESQDMLLAWQSSNRRSMFGPISIEGLHQVPPTAPMSTLRHYYDLGVRMATLTWNCHNPFADASLVWNDFSAPPSVVNGVFRPEQGAVTDRGKQVLQEMNLLGIIIDLSHTSYWTQKAVLSKDKHGNGITRAPVVFSHSSAYSICPHPRNVRDDILDLVPKANSLVMVNFSPDFISCTSADEESTNSPEPHFSLPEFYEKNNTLHQVAQHITYIGQRIGYDYVGLGSDFDGMGERTPKGLEGVDKYPDLVAELLTMGVSDEDAKKVVGGNVLRVWGDVEDVSAKMKDEGVEPGLDDASGY